MYTKKELVSFGNYLLSKERKQNVKPQDQDEVWHSDFENWLVKYNTGDVSCSKINVLVTYYGEKAPWQSKRPLLKTICEVGKLTDINKIFQSEIEDLKILISTSEK